jgi:2-polyprenylphenol hydroxylase and related flavodoxin oxidoreductases
MSLEEVRNRIDAIDADIVSLLDERAAAGRETAAFKQQDGKPLRNIERENQVVERAISLSNGSMPARSLETIYRTIMGETLAQETTSRHHCEGHTGKRDVLAAVLTNEMIAPDFYKMRVRAPDLAGAFSPGQFFQMRLDAGVNGFFLRRPFAPSAYTEDGFEFVYRLTGDGTASMTSLSYGDSFFVLAPLGNSYSLPAAGTSALLIGGGCGAPSIVPLAKALKEREVRVTVVIGARTAGMLLECDAFGRIADRVVVATDDGSLGCKGTVVDAYALEKVERPDGIFACGPTPMLRAAAGLAERLGISAQVSLEERMACGFGACMGCAVPVKAANGTVYRRVCHDGPIFDAARLKI